MRATGAASSPGDQEVGQRAQTEAWGQQGGDGERTGSGWQQESLVQALGGGWGRGCPCCAHPPTPLRPQGRPGCPCPPLRKLLEARATLQRGPLMPPLYQPHPVRSPASPGAAITLGLGPRAQSSCSSCGGGGAARAGRVNTMPECTMSCTETCVQTGAHVGTHASDPAGLLCHRWAKSMGAAHSQDGWDGLSVVMG